MAGLTSRRMTSSLGISGWSDFSIRDHHYGLRKIDWGPLTWGLTKNWDTSNSCGPYMVVDDGHDANNRSIVTRVNGVVRQDSTTAKMTSSFAQTFAFLSTYLTLNPADMLVSGTPSGTAIEAGVDGPFLRDGDEVEIEIEGVGTLRNRIRFP